MLLGLPAAAVVAEMGDGPTTGARLARHLRALEWAVSGPHLPSRGIPRTAVARVRWALGGSHWVLLHAGRVYDPELVVRDVVLARATAAWRVVSYLAVSQPAATVDGWLRP